MMITSVHRLHIIIITLDFFGPSAISRGARQHATALLNYGNLVTVVTDILNLNMDSIFRKKYKNRFRSVIIKSYSSPFLYLAVKEVSFAIQIFSLLKKIEKKRHVDLIINQVSNASYGVEKFSEIYKIATVFVIRSLIFDRLKNNCNSYNWITTKMYKISNRFTLKNTKNLVAVSKYIKNIAIEEGANHKNIYVVHNPVDTKRFYPEKN